MVWTGRETRGGIQMLGKLESNLLRNVSRSPWLLDLKSIQSDRTLESQPKILEIRYDTVEG